jgi:hypothetical protein
LKTKRKGWRWSRRCSKGKGADSLEGTEVEGEEREREREQKESK